MKDADTSKGPAQRNSFTTAVWEKIIAAIHTLGWTAHICFAIIAPEQGWG